MPPDIGGNEIMYGIDFIWDNVITKYLVSRLNVHSCQDVMSSFKLRFCVYTYVVRMSSVWHP